MRHLASRRRRVSCRPPTALPERVASRQRSPIVESVGSSQVHVLDPDVQRDAGAGFPADACSRTFQSETPSSEDRRCRASCSEVATRVEWQATRRRKREPEASQEENSEKLGVKTGMARRGHARKRQNSHWPTLGAKCPRSEGEARPQCTTDEATLQFLSSSTLPSVFLRTRLGIFQLILPGLYPLSKSAQGGASKPTSKRRSLLATAPSRWWPWTCSVSAAVVCSPTEGCLDWKV